MRGISHVLTVLVLVMTVCPLSAQELMYPDMRTIASDDTYLLVSPKAVWNGSQWGMLYYGYTNIDYRVYFVRLSMEGKVVGGYKLLFKSEGDVDPRTFEICADDSGWGVLAVNRHNTSKLYDLAFYRLGKKGNFLGKATTIFKNEGNNTILPPVWTGSYYMIFYSIHDDSDGFGLSLALLDPKGKKIRKDINYKSSLEGGIFFRHTAVNEDGVALFGTEWERDRTNNYIFMKVDFEGNELVPITRLPGSQLDYRVTTGFVWNGSDYLASFQEGAKWEVSKPYLRFITAEGAWAGKKKTVPHAHDHSVTGLACSADYYVLVGYRRLSMDHFYRVLNTRLKPATKYELLLENAQWGGIYLYGIGARLGLFGYFATPNIRDSERYLIYNALAMPDTGKPDIIGFDGRVISLFGKKYALLSWRVDGVDTVTIKTKGYKGKKAASGVLLLNVRKESTFQLKTRNDSGKAKARLKIKP